MGHGLGLSFELAIQILHRHPHDYWAAAGTGIRHLRSKKIVDERIHFLLGE